MATKFVYVAAFICRALYPGHVRSDRGALGDAHYQELQFDSQIERQRSNITASNRQPPPNQQKSIRIDAKSSKIKTTRNH